MSNYQRFMNLSEDLSEFGLVRDSLEGYFCTPANCTVFARLGADGGHFCYLNTVSEEKAPVFLMNPMAAEKGISTTKRIISITGDRGYL